MAHFDIPPDAKAGLWDVHVPTRADGTLTLTDSFLIMDMCDTCICDVDSIDQLCPCAGPRGMNVPWSNHGNYVSCVAKTADTFLEQELITEEEKDAIVSQAAKSDCGHKK